MKEDYDLEKILDKYIYERKYANVYNQYDNDNKRYYDYGYYDYASAEMIKQLEELTEPTEEEILEKMDIKIIEAFLRKKKLQKINSK